MTPRERLERCLTDKSIRAPRSRQMVDLLNRDGRYRATIRSWTCNTDRKVGRLRIPGLGRDGYKIEVYPADPRGELLFSHATSETYRTNRELAAKVLELLTRPRP